MPNSKHWFQLSQILAILSGTWAVSTAIFASQTHNFFFLQNQINTMILNCQNSNSSLCLNYTASMTNAIIQPLGTSIKFYTFFFFLAMIFAIGSLFFWVCGTYKDRE